MKGVPLRLELGPKDIEQNQCVLVRRDNGEKSFVSLDALDDSRQRAAGCRARRHVCQGKAQP